VLNKTFIVV